LATTRDTGASESALEHGRNRGVGLANVEQRIRRHFGGAGAFGIRSAPGVGTTVELGLPINAAGATAKAAGTARSTNSFEARRKQA
jgi:LytS/YehU family sensor histidine kinase